MGKDWEFDFDRVHRGVQQPARQSCCSIRVLSGGTHQDADTETELGVQGYWKQHLL